MHDFASIALRRTALPALRRGRSPLQLLARCRAALASMLLLWGCAPPNTDCADYRSASVAEMRTAFWSGCFELRHLVVVARTPTGTTPRMYAQDPSGGDYSAIMAKCDGTSSHPCSTSTAAVASNLLDGSAVTLRGYYYHGMHSDFEELLLDEVIDEGSMLAQPSAVSLGPADLARDARSTAQWFQRARVDVAKDDPLVMYDMSPAEFRSTGECPSWRGFAVIPLSAGTTPPADCSASINPASLQQADPGEVLIGRQFFNTFSYSTDCACAASRKQHLLSPSNFVSGAMTGILTLESDGSSSGTYQVFEPLSKADFPIR